MWETHLVDSWLLCVMMRGEWRVTGGKIYWGVGVEQCRNDLLEFESIITIYRKYM